MLTIGQQSWYLRVVGWVWVLIKKQPDIMFYCFIITQHEVNSI